MSLTCLSNSASVDLETDKKIQHSIATEYHDRTLLCIARTWQPLPSIPGLLIDPIDRLRTILNYDRILVLDAGRVAVSVSMTLMQPYLTHAHRSSTRQRTCSEMRRAFSVISVNGVMSLYEKFKLHQRTRLLDGTNFLRCRTANVNDRNIDAMMSWARALFKPAGPF
jgi:hypothetical protein